MRKLSFKNIEIFQEANDTARADTQDASLDDAQVGR